jgi:hypothetical protein
MPRASATPDLVITALDAISITFLFGDTRDPGWGSESTTKVPVEQPGDGFPPNGEPALESAIEQPPRTTAAKVTPIMRMLASYPESA